MKIRVVQIFFTVLFVLLIAYLYYLQIMKGQLYRDLSFRNSIRLLNIAAPRGGIYDRNNRPIAGNSLSFGVFIVPQEARDKDAEMRDLASVLGVSKSFLERNYKRNYTAPFAPCELFRGASKEAVIKIEEMRPNMPGVMVREMPSRDYLYKDAFSHAVGYVGEIDQAELELLRPYGYGIKDMIGKDGIERFYDATLRGKNGGMQVQVDNMGRQVKILGSKKPQRGKDVYLSLDLRLQVAVWNLMRELKGAAIFMDPNNGEILCLVSAPSYDPGASLASLLRDRDSPLLNRAVMGQYPAGSIFKIVVALAGLETKKVSIETTFLCAGKLKVGNKEFNCWNRDGHGSVNLNSAITQSCNVYFYSLGILVGADKIYEYAEQFGFGRKTGVDLFGEADGFVPSRQWRHLEKKEKWYSGDTANLSIGQGELLVTPLQIARMVSAVANNGYLVEPHLIRRKGAPGPGVRKAIKLKIKNENLEAVKNAMKEVVGNVDGTGIRARSALFSVSAKTGTAQAGPGLPSHAWIAGFAPSENPEISFVVFLERGGSGGDLPAEIARQALEYWWTHEKI